MTLLPDSPTQNLGSVQVLFQGFEVLAMNAGDCVSRENVFRFDDLYAVLDSVEPEAHHVPWQFLYPIDAVQEDVFHGDWLDCFHFVGHDGYSYGPRLLDENYSTVWCNFQDILIGNADKKNGYFLSKLGVDSFTRPKFWPCQGVSDQEQAQFLLVVCPTLQREFDLYQIVGMQDQPDFVEDQDGLALDCRESNEATRRDGWDWFGHTPSFHQLTKPVSQPYCADSRQHKGKPVECQRDFVSFPAELQEGSGVYGKSLQVCFLSCRGAPGGGGMARGH